MAGVVCYNRGFPMVKAERGDRDGIVQKASIGLGCAALVDEAAGTRAA